MPTPHSVKQVSMRHIPFLAAAPLLLLGAQMISEYERIDQVDAAPEPFNTARH